MSVVVRQATEDDGDEIYNISNSVHLTPLYQRLIPVSERERFLRRYTSSPNGLANFYEKYITRLHDSTWKIWVAEYDGTVVGYTASHVSGEVVELKGLFVDETYQGRGIGKQLLAASIDIVQPGKTIILEVLEGNLHALSLYGRIGFKKGPVIDTFYGAPLLQMYKY